MHIQVPRMLKKLGREFWIHTVYEIRRIIMLVIDLKDSGPTDTCIT